MPDPSRHSYAAARVVLFLVSDLAATPPPTPNPAEARSSRGQGRSRRERDEKNTESKIGGVAVAVLAESERLAMLQRQRWRAEIASLSLRGARRSPAALVQLKFGEARAPRLPSASRQSIAVEIEDRRARCGSSFERSVNPRLPKSADLTLLSEPLGR